MPPIGEVDVDAERLPGQYDLRANKPAFRASPAGIGDRAPIQRGSLAADFKRVATTDTQREPQPRDTIALKRLQRIDMQGATARAGIELRLEQADTQLGKS